ncbi:MAG TPA: hypothetical protein VFH47_06655, partial [Candidatus Thermoplasmatota archaeon]|nr:hypothetical protein [Candidatus Thermoplasmatota archaeon]
MAKDGAGGQHRDPTAERPLVPFGGTAETPPSPPAPPLVAGSPPPATAPLPETGFAEELSGLVAAEHLAPLVREAQAHFRAQSEACRNGDVDALLKEERAHAARLANAAEMLIEYETIRDTAIGNVPIDERLDALLESTCLVLGSQSAALLLIDEEGEHLWPRASLGFKTTLAVRPVAVTGAVWELVRAG